MLRRKDPYQAMYVDSKARWPPLIDCGHNPFLMAHLVEDLQVETHDDWTETATWRDVRLVKKRTEEWANPPKVSHLLKLFAEARYHRMFRAHGRDFTFIPATFAYAGSPEPGRLLLPGRLLRFLQTLLLIERVFAAIVSYAPLAASAPA